MLGNKGVLTGGIQGGKLDGIQKPNMWKLRRSVTGAQVGYSVLRCLGEAYVSLGVYLSIYMEMGIKVRAYRNGQNDGIYIPPDSSQT